MNIIRPFLLLSALLTCAATANAQVPVNDDCAGALTVSIGNMPFDPRAASDGTGLALDPLICDMSLAGDDQIYQDVWFSFAAPSTDNYTFGITTNNSGPNYDSRIAIYNQSTCPDDPNLVIGCDDNSGEGSIHASASNVPLILGQTYLVRAGSFSPGTIEEDAILNITTTPAPQVNDNCSGAIVVTTGTTLIDNRAATTDGIALDPLVCDMGGGFLAPDDIWQDLWFHFTPSTSAMYDITVLHNINPAGSHDSRLALYNQTTCPDNPALVIACDDNSGSGREAKIGFQPLVAGTTYLLRVGTTPWFGTNLGEPTTLSIMLTAQPPSNDLCATPLFAGLGASQIDTRLTLTDGLPLDPMVCDMGPDLDEQIYNDLWFEFTAPSTDTYEFDTNVSFSQDFCTRIAIYNQTTCPADPADVIACDSASQGCTSLLQVNLTGGSTYLIRVGSVAAMGLFQRGLRNLIISIPGPPSANDDCGTAAQANLGFNPFDSTTATTGTGLALDPLVCDMGLFGDDQIYNDLWFTFTPGTTNFYDISSVNGAFGFFDSRLAVYNQSTCPDDPNLVIACDDDSLAPFQAAVSSVALNSGQTYLIRVGSYAPGIIAKPADLVIAAGAPPPVTPANDNCSAATPITTFGTYLYDNRAATTDGSNLTGWCDTEYFFGNQIERDVWFAYTPISGGCTYISTLGFSAQPTIIAVYNAATCPDDVASVIACSSDEDRTNGGLAQGGLDVDLMAGTTYLIRIGHPTPLPFPGGPMGVAGSFVIAAGPVAVNLDGGMQTGAPGCGPPPPAFPQFCFGDGGNQMGCTNCPCGNEAPIGSGGGCLNSGGAGTRLVATGAPSVSLAPGDTTDLRFGADGAPPNAFCILNSGDAVAPGNMANPCFGMNSGAQAAAFDGLRCAIMNTRRHGGRSANANGEVGVTNSPWGGEGGPPVGIANAGGGFAAGQTRFFQIINRDDPLAICMRALNTSQAVEITFTP